MSKSFDERTAEKLDGFILDSVSNPMLHTNNKEEKFEKVREDKHTETWHNEYYGEVFINKKLLHQELQKAREEERKKVLWNIGAMIEEAEFDAKVAERTGDATATWEVQSVVKQIQTIIDRYQSELHQDNRNTMLDITNLTGKEIFQSNDSELHQDNK